MVVVAAAGCGGGHLHVAVVLSLSNYLTPVPHIVPGKRLLR